MSNRDAKHLRSLARDIVKESIPGFLTAEIYTEANKKLVEEQKTFNETLSKVLTQRLDTIEADCKAALDKQDKRARAVQGFLVQGAQKEINEHVHNIHVTLLAWEELMTTKIYNANEIISTLTLDTKSQVQTELKSLLDNFSQELDEHKKTVAARMQAAAEEAMTKRITPEEAPNTADTVTQEPVSA